MQLNVACRRALFAGSSTAPGAECRPLRAFGSVPPVSEAVTLRGSTASRKGNDERLRHPDRVYPAGEPASSSLLSPS
jgi:hypothetical protein